MFFTHNTQYSLLLLIHVQVQCDLAITRFTCINVCLLNCFDLFFKYKIGQTCLVCMCVCFEIKMLDIFLLKDIFESSKCCLDPWLCYILNFIHICVFPFLKNCFKVISTPLRHLAYLSSSSIDSYRNLDTSRQLGGSIEKPSILSIAPRYLLDPSSLLCCGHLDTSQQLHMSKLLKLDTCFDTSRHLYLSRFTKVLYIGSYSIRTSVSQSFSFCPWLFISQALTSLSKPLPQGFFQA